MELDNGYYGSPRWSYEILDCAMPMTFDTYSNCAHQCLYCFSFFQRAIGQGGDDYLHHRVRSVDVERVKRMFRDPDQHAGQFKNYIKRRMTLQWGGLSDGFDFYERKFRKSLELLKFFNEIDYPLSISTKGVWFVDDPEYQEQLKDRKNIHFKYSIITSNEDHVKKIEPGVPTARARFAAMEKLSKLGIAATTLRFRPFIIGTSDLCIEEMMTMAEDSGCYSVTTEFLGWESRSSNNSRDRLKAISDVVGYDVWEFYTKNSARANGLLRLNYDLKRPYMDQMEESAARHNLKFFVSDAHHKEKSYHAGCCGLPEDGILSNVNRGQYAHAIKLARANGFVKWSDISEEARSLLESIPVIAAEGFNSGTTLEHAKRLYLNMYEYMHDIWNNPKSWQSPARYFGGALVPSNTDENGDIIYLYNKPFIEDNKRISSVSALALELRMVGKPNAERFDEMTADGTNYGHVAYPVYVFSRGRWGNATTPNLLDKAHVNYNLVVQASELQRYQDAFPNADIIALPNGLSGVSAAKTWIWAMAREEGYPYIWMLDDDIKDVEYKAEKVSLRHLFSTLEQFIEDYSNVSMLTVGNNEWSENPKEFNVGSMGRGLALVNLNTGIGFNLLQEVYEDYYFALSNLDNGFVPILYNHYSIQTAQLPGGGMSGVYARPGLVEANAKQINNRWPANTNLVDAPLPFRTVIDIDWSSFSVPVRSRQVELLVKGE